MTKRTHSDLQSITQKTKDRATLIPLKPRVELKCYGRVSSSCSTCDIRRVTVKRHLSSDIEIVLDTSIRK